MQANGIGSFFGTPVGIACWAVFSLVVGYLTLNLVSTVSGWHALSKRFKQQSAPYGEIKTAGPFFYTVYMRFWGHYSSVIRLSAASDGLYASVLFLFRIGHPPLRIPWEEIKFGKAQWFFRTYIVLTLGNEEMIPMRISQRMARNLGILDRVPACAWCS
jgi:hypothetical protein